METNSIVKSFMIENSENRFSEFLYISWNVSKSISWTFLGSLHNETVKYVFHEIARKKYFSVGNFMKYVFHEMFMIYFLNPFMKWKSISIEFVFMLDQFFYYQWRLRKCKEKCKHKIKGRLKEVFRILGISYFWIWKIDWSSIFRIMNE